MPVFVSIGMVEDRKNGVMEYMAAASPQEEMVQSWMRLCKDPRTAVDLLENASYWESINLPRQFIIRMAVAKHRSTSSDLLTKLSMVNYLPLQIAVAGHPNLSEATAGKMMQKQLRELRKALAGNPKIPEFVMERLCRDFKDVRACLARNPKLPVKYMKVLATHKEREVRVGLARNPYLAVSVLEKLSKDADDTVRMAVAYHQRLPMAGLRALAADPSNQVREVIFERAQEDYPYERSIFEAIAAHKSSLLAQQAEDHLRKLETTGKTMENLLESLLRSGAGKRQPCLNLDQGPQFFELLLANSFDGLKTFWFFKGSILIAIGNNAFGQGWPYSGKGRQFLPIGIVDIYQLNLSRSGFLLAGFSNSSLLGSGSHASGITEETEEKRGKLEGGD